MTKIINLEVGKTYTSKFGFDREVTKIEKFKDDKEHDLVYYKFAYGGSDWYVRVSFALENWSEKQ